MDHDDFDQEPIRGLPEMLPEGETILWQGRPDWWALTVEALSLKWVAGYFVVLFGWSAVVKGAEMSVPAAIGQSSFYLVLGGGVCLLLMAIGWAQAKSTVYTVTDRRVVMRIGAALTMTLQFPFQWIGAADLTTRRGGTGTIALRTLGKTRFSYLLLWPHLRPWRFAPTQPALRCIPDAARVARLMAEAVGSQPVPAPAPQDAPAAMPVPAE
ncbi:MAG: photosynthetic complex putative assembly protein PuhB [Pseudomonadota bacterium]